MTNPEVPGPESTISLPSDMTEAQLRQYLLDAHVPLLQYGSGAAKTLDHLLDEVNQGESLLTLDAGGNLLRHVNVLWVDVLCALSNGDTYLLREDRQEFKDGRVKVRNLDSSLGEKLKPDESLEDGVRRALAEEIGVSDIDELHQTGYSEKTFVPDTYPGLESTYKMYGFVSVIPESAFVPEGYTEFQADKTNYYTWSVIHRSSD